MYKLHLILKYLRKRRIAWVSLVAVTLCTTMVLVVISVMGGWLRMFQANLKGVAGDIVITGGGDLKGFAYYQQVLEKLKDVPEVEAAVPTIKTLGLVNIGGQMARGLQVYGYPMDQIGKVTRFPQSLYYEYKRYIDEAAAPGTSPQKRSELLKAADASAQNLKLEKLFPAAVYDEQVANSSSWPGMILGNGVLGIYSNLDGGQEGRDDWKYLLPVTMAVKDVSARSLTESGAITPRSYRIVDDSHTAVYQIDALSAYVSFDLLQADLGMDAQELTNEVTGKTMTRPARANEIQIRVKQGVSLEVAKQKIAAAVNEVFEAAAARERAQSLPDWSKIRPTVQTWREHQAKLISAIENEKVLMIFLFGMISLVAVFLIFCIFYMIVAEKTKDIGIIKSVGASDAGVAGIFLGYGLAIGIVGAGTGTLIGYLIVHNINYLHQKAGEVLGIRVFTPGSYAFDSIPNQIDTTEVTTIVGIAVLASVLGSLLPAFRASRMHPIRALHNE